MRITVKTPDCKVVVDLPDDETPEELLATFEGVWQLVKANC